MNIQHLATVALDVPNFHEKGNCQPKILLANALIVKIWRAIVVAERKKSALLVVLITIILTLIMALVYSITHSTAIQIGLLGTYIGIAISLLLGNHSQMRKIREQNDQFIEITENPFGFEFYKNTVGKLRNAASFTDPLFQKLVCSHLNSISSNLSTISSGVIEFRAESWRGPWKEILSQKDVKFYNSVSLVKSENYWQNIPGKEAIDFNKQLAASMPIKRIFIVWDSLWDNSNIRNWIIDQRDSDIEVLVVKKSDVPVEEELFYDLGIYGDRAVGYQILDQDCNTLKFKFKFSREDYEKTKTRFEKLTLYATKDATEEYLAQLAPASSI